MNELDKLQKAFEQEHITPSQRARKEAIGAALLAFDEKVTPQHQGSSLAHRLIKRGNKFLQTLFRRRKMIFPQLRRSYIVGGAAASLVAVGLIFTGLNNSHRYGIVPTKNDGLLGMFNRTGGETRSDRRTAGATAGKKDREFKTALLPPLNEEMDGEMLLEMENAKPNTVVTDNTRIISKLSGLKPATPKVLHASKGKTSGNKRLFINRPTSIAKTRGAASPGSSSMNFGFSGNTNIANAPAISGILVSADKDGRRRVLTQRTIAPRDQITSHYREQGRDRFTTIKPNEVKLVRQAPVSTFSVDVDTSSYSFMRASLNRGALPQKNAVRIEELVNYFPYDYEGPSDRSLPFKANVTIMPSPLNAHNKLLHIGIKGYQLPKTDKPRANLVFLIDSSGSMHAPNKLPLVQNAFKLLLSKLDPEDTIAIVTYAGNAGTVLKPTKARERAKILAAIENLRAGGSTAGAEGIRQAYQLAAQNYDDKAVNRVILATDGDFNVGIYDRQELKSFIERKRKTGVFLSILGFGMGNYNDALMQTLAQNGNGVAAYIDNLSEARKVLVQEAGSTLFPIAKDVKIQIEFNPATVKEYRLIGFETRMLKRQDFNNDKVDAGDIGSGHRVTALYEITPTGSAGALVDDLRYGNKDKTAKIDGGNEYAFLKIRYKLPKSDKSILITTPVTKDMEIAQLASAPTEARFAISVAAFGQLLRGGRHTQNFTYDDVIKLAQAAKGTDQFGYRSEFIQLVRLAKTAAALQVLPK